MSCSSTKKPPPNRLKQWVYDYRTNVHKTLKTKKLSREDLDDFVRCYKTRKETDRFRPFPYEDLITRDKLNLDLFWLKNDSLEDIDSLPEPEVLAAEITENLQAALESCAEVVGELRQADWLQPQPPAQSAASLANSTLGGRLEALVGASGPFSIQRPVA